MLSAAGVVSAFLATASLGQANSSIDSRSWVALALLAGSSVVFVVLLWPTEWRLGMSTEILLKDYADHDPPLTVAEVDRVLVEFLAEAESDNASKLDVRYRLFCFGAALFVAETLIWLVILYTRVG